MNDFLTDDNLLLYAAKMYDNPQCCDTEEFETDMKRFKYIKRLVNKFVDSGELRERLILNHIIILYNVFGAEATSKMLFLMNEANMSVIKPFLVYLKILPGQLTKVKSYEVVHTASIPMDQRVIEALRQI